MTGSGTRPGRSYHLKQGKHNLHSIYGAMLHNRSGWAAAANAILELKMPGLQSTQADNDSATDLVCKLGTFAEHFVAWLHKIAQAILQYWGTPGYKRSRAQSGASIED